MDVSAASRPALTLHEQCTAKPKSISSTLLEILAQRPKAAREKGKCLE